MKIDYEKIKKDAAKRFEDIITSCNKADISELEGLVCSSLAASINEYDFEYKKVKFIGFNAKGLLGCKYRGFDFEFAYIRPMDITVCFVWRNTGDPLCKILNTREYIEYSHARVCMETEVDSFWLKAIDKVLDTHPEWKPAIWEEL